MTYLFSTLLFVLLAGTCLSNPQSQSGISQCGSLSYECVPHFQCIDGVINTDGIGLIDVRIKPQGTCTNHEYPDVVSICCLIPGGVVTPTPINTCPFPQECVYYNQCGADGLIVTDGSGLIDIRTQHDTCWVSQGEVGRCCTPIPVYIDCPVGSVCIVGTDCRGQAYDVSSQFLDYVTPGEWSKCSFGSFDGICCINPTEVPLLPADRCGVRNDQLNPRISTTGLENNEALFGEFPWQAIIFYQNYTYNCGATLITNKHLLTAAHCVKDLFASDIRVRLGEWKVSNFDEKLPYVDYNVHAIYSHQAFNPKNVHNDIAILELVDFATFEYHINTVCMPQPGIYYESGKRCFISGWGKDTFQGNFQHILKKVDVPFVDKATCQALLRHTRLGKFFRLDESFVCAGGEENKDACSGDGGGPLVCQNLDSGLYELVGITAWGIGCGARDVPGVYVDVALFLSWIDDIVLGASIGGTGPISGYGK